ncbi:hypothetical protein BGZ54_001443 [Gamsiella multidivaricata]|nr:hypothetical protein BGZ54_001443 [Gamsiella multidivaricata]
MPVLTVPLNGTPAASTRTPTRSEVAIAKSTRELELERALVVNERELAEARASGGYSECDFEFRDIYCEDPDHVKKKRAMLTKDRTEGFVIVKESGYVAYANGPGDVPPAPF